ncbi:MAG: hypothetical protein ABIU87_12020 [Ornithinibacter sp.]
MAEVDGILDDVAHEWADDVACAEPHPRALHHLMASVVSWLPPGESGAARISFRRGDVPTSGT